jgi:PIN domain nuclease of toxin-antitoxin system
MKAIVDAYGLIAYFRDEAAAGAVQRLIRGGLGMTAVHMTEVFDRMIRLYGANEQELEVAFTGLNVEIVSVDSTLGPVAGSIRARHFARTGRQLSLADAICAATALSLAVPLATADRVLASVMQIEGGKVIELPLSA